MTLQQKLRSLYEPFRDINCEVFHYTRGDYNIPPYVIWAETSEDNSFHAENHKQEQQLTGIVDLYTLEEFDSLADDIQEILDEEQIGWRLESVQYEEETNLTHYQWRWWTCG